MKLIGVRKTRGQRKKGGCEKKREGVNDNSERGDPDFEAGRDKVCNSGSGECVICLAVNMEGKGGGHKNVRNMPLEQSKEDLHKHFRTKFDLTQQNLT